MLGFIRLILGKLTKKRTHNNTVSQEEVNVITESLNVDTEIRKLIDQKKDEELSHPPTIAIIGKTGVGKSTTINSLFKTSLGVSHFEACTQKAIPVTLTNGKGNIIIYDMPGLGEDEEKDEEHKNEYRRILPLCDVILWITDIADREMSSQQRYIRELESYINGKLVICANKADTVHPEDWNNSFNLPSNEQLEILNKRIIDIRKGIRKVLPNIDDQVIVYYSATKRYKLDTLFGAMLEACPRHRGWVLNERIELADYKELIDPEILNKLRNGN